MNDNKWIPKDEWTIENHIKYKSTRTQFGVAWQDANDILVVPTESSS